MKQTRTLGAGSQAVAGRLSIALVLAACSSCETITGVAPKNTPRVEIELAVVVEDAFVSPLEDVEDDSPLYAAVKQAVRDKADLGLRFYPTPSERYGADDLRPDYLMTVEVERLSFQFEHEKVEGEDEVPRIETSVAKVGCEVRVSIEHRRSNAPSLIVSTASASSEVSAETDAEALAMGSGYVPIYEGEPLRVLEKDILRAVQNAVDRALKSMRTPIDREFAPKANQDTQPAANQG